MKQDDYLRQALSELAQEEADQLESSLTRDERRQAESMFQRHKKKALALIERQKPKRKGSQVFLRVAAVLVLLAGGAYLLSRPSQPDYTLVLPPASASTTPLAMASDDPGAASIPTLSPIPFDSETMIPTYSPIPYLNVVDFPTLSPSPMPTPIPTATPVPFAPVPADWQGEYFPAALPISAALTKVTNENGVHTAVYTLDGEPLIFSEHEASTPIPLNESSGAHYVSVNGAAVALRSVSAQGVTLTWDQFGRSFSLTAPESLAEGVAASLKKIP